VQWVRTRKQRDKETKASANKGSGRGFGQVTMVLCFTAVKRFWAGLKVTIGFVFQLSQGDKGVVKTMKQSKQGNSY